MLLFYLYGTVQDIDIHVGKCVSSGKGGKNVVAVHAAMFLTDGEELAVRTAIKHLSRALGVLRFVWEAANSDNDGASDNGKEVTVKRQKGAVQKARWRCQGHLWVFDVEDKELTYRGDVFYVHQTRMP